MYRLKLKSPGRQLNLLDLCKYFSSLHYLDFFHYILVSIWRRHVFDWCLSGFSNMMYTFQCKPFYIPILFFAMQVPIEVKRCQVLLILFARKVFCFVWCTYYVSPYAGQSLELTSSAITEAIGTIQFICPIVNWFIFALVDLSSWLLGCLKLRCNAWIADTDLACICSLMFFNYIMLV
jgi:hypothetical protein